MKQERLLLNNIHFDSNCGEVVLIEGPNGSGKSSLLKLLTGLVTPYAGDVEWQGESIYSNPFHYSGQFHYIGHTNGLKLGLTVMENLHLACRLTLTGNVSLDNVLALLKLETVKTTLAAQLSAGQKRRVALAKLFLVPKPLWILDEPLTALDTDMQQLFLKQLSEHLQQNGIAIMSTHHALSFAHSVKTIRLEQC